MKLALVIEPDAEEDISIGYRWYEERQVGLGTKFLDALEALFDQILENPQLEDLSTEGLLRGAPAPIKSFDTDASDTGAD